MSAALVLSETLVRSRAAMRHYLRNTRSANTLKAYATDCRYFVAWCEANGLSALPAEPGTVALYLSDLAGQRSMSCVERRLSAIGAMHEMANYPSPTRDDHVRRVMRGIRRTKGLAQRRKA